MDITTELRFKRLPTWAKQEIIRLTNELERASDAASRARRDQSTMAK